MATIYEPKGKAGEYSPLACNLYRGCTHGCTYCYAPSVLRMKREDFHGKCEPRKNILAELEKDCKKLAGDLRPVLLSFTSDAYQPREETEKLTRQAIEILGEYDMTITVLTKAALAERDFDLFVKYDVAFGMTIVFADDDVAARWEPNASSITERERVLRKAKSLGISTWVSIEPVIYPLHALAIVEKMADTVDLWKVGKLNYDKEQEAAVDWPVFLNDMLELLNTVKAKYYIKDDLWKLRSKDCKYPKENR